MSEVLMLIWNTIGAILLITNLVFISVLLFMNIKDLFKGKTNE